MINLSNLTSTRELYNITDVRTSMLDILEHTLYNFINDKNMFSIEDFSAIYFDEFSLDTNCNDDIFSTLYLEIDEPQNYKPIKVINKKYKKENNKIKVPNLYLTITDIKNGLMKELINILDSSNIVWQDKFAICIKSTIKYNEKESTNYYFRIIPCFTYYNKNNVRGVLYYHNNDIQIEYPKQCNDNFDKKNDETKGLYQKTVNVFKNILLKEKDIKQLPSEIIETMLYNVPNVMFKDLETQSIINIINFIRNNPLKDFKTIDEQDFAFASSYRSMSLFYVQHITKIIMKYIQ